MFCENQNELYLQINFVTDADATHNKHSNVQKYEHWNKNNPVQLAHVSHADFYRDKLMTFQTLNQD